LITQCCTIRIPIFIELPIYIAPVTLLIIAYTPTSPIRATLAAFRVSVRSKFPNSLTRGGKELEELEELDELEELEEFSELDELEELERGAVEGPKRLVEVVLKLIIKSVIKTLRS
jgi:hypothetical protein